MRFGGIPCLADVAFFCDANVGVEIFSVVCEAAGYWRSWKKSTAIIIQIIMINFSASDIQSRRCDKIARANEWRTDKMKGARVKWRKQARNEQGVQNTKTLQIRYMHNCGGFSCRLCRNREQHWTTTQQINNLIGWIRKNNHGTLLVQYFDTVCHMTTWNCKIWGSGHNANPQ